MVLRLRQHNIGYTADGFYRSDDPTNSVKALKEGGTKSFNRLTPTVAIWVNPVPDRVKPSFVIFGIWAL